MQAPPTDTPFVSVLERASTAFIQYPRLMNLHQSIQRCHVLTKKLHDPQCMALEGAPGVGKTTLTKMYAAAFPRNEQENGTHIPVFYILTPSPVTVKGFASTMLRSLGDPLADRGTLTSLNTRLIHYLKACKVELVIIDDFHHLIDIETDKILRTVSEWLKVILRLSGVPFLVVGVEGQVRRILRTNGQLSRHFCTCETLNPFQWEGDDSIKEFSYFITYIEQAIGVNIRVDIPREELLRRIHYATAGVVGNIMNLLRYAAVRAEEADCQSISLSDLTWAFDARLLEHMTPRINPFGTVVGNLFVAPQLLPVSDLEGVRRKRRRERKKKEPSVADILKT